MTLDISKIEAAILAQPEQQPFSGVIYLKENQKVVFAQAFGLANRAEAIPNKIDTKFGIASGTKIFTAVAICQLLEKNLLNLDTRLTECLPFDFPQFDPAITVKHLLTHTSGIPDYFDEEVMTDFAALWKTRPMYEMRRPADFLPMFQNEPMKFAPGTGWAYNNAGFIVLGLIVEQVSGLAFADYVQTHILNLCEMHDSGFFAMNDLPPNSAYGYIQNAAGKWLTNFYAVPIIGGPDGGMFTTAQDIEKFWQALFSYRLLSEATTKLLLTPHTQTPYANSENFYGLGIWIRQKNGEIFSYHIEGQDPGVRFISTIYPQSQVEFTLLGNTVEATNLLHRRLRNLLF